MNRRLTAPLVLVILFVGMNVSSAVGAGPLHLRADLSSVEARGPHPGRAHYKGEATDERRTQGVRQKGSGRKLRVRVRVEDVADGTVATVTACDESVGSITLRKRGRFTRGMMRLRSKKGDDVPVCTNGAAISISGTGMTTLSGEFGVVGDN